MRYSAAIASLLQSKRPVGRVAELGSLGRLRAMHSILATDYGNFWTFLTVGPVLLLALVIGLLAWFFRARWLAVTSGVACIATGVAFLLSLPQAKSDGRVFTISVAAVAVITGLALALTKRGKIR